VFVENKTKAIALSTMCKPTDTPATKTYRLVVPTSLFHSQVIRTDTVILSSPPPQPPLTAASSGITNNPSVLNYSPTFQQEQDQSTVQPTHSTLRDERLRLLSEYQRFLIFIKIMLKILEQNEEHSTVQKANMIIDRCWKYHCMGNDNYQNFQEAVVCRLRTTISELYWNLTSDYLGYSCD